jgi:hypothetical protein
VTPKVLYKYVVPDRIDILLNKRIRFTQACLLNDPFEFRLGSRDGLPPFQARIDSKRTDEFEEKSHFYGVLSLAERNDSIPMWTHYAASHTGFVIGFDTGSSMFVEAMKNPKLRHVDYRPERVSATEGLPGQPYVGPGAVLWTKSEDWQYEGEWRWIECRSPYDYAEVVAAPNGELLFLRAVPPGSVREVILGCRVNPLLADSIQVLKSSPDYKHIELFKATLHKSKYGLQIEPL